METSEASARRRMAERRRNTLFPSLSSIVTMASQASLSEFVTWVWNGAPDLQDFDDDGICDVEQQPAESPPKSFVRSTSLKDMPMVTDDLPPPILYWGDDAAAFFRPITAFVCTECGEAIKEGMTIFCVADGRFCTPACRGSYVQRKGVGKLAKLFA